MPINKFNVGYGGGTIKHEFLRIKDGVTTFELVSDMTNGAEEISSSRPCSGSARSTASICAQRATINHGRISPKRRALALCGTRSSEG
jgi:hypothetical protein